MATVRKHIAMSVIIGSRLRGNDIAGETVHLLFPFFAVFFAALGDLLRAVADRAPERAPLRVD
ncbi:MAG: hypothetical protein ACJ8D4_23870, partial [Xanthobacteraceae bacterium]